MIDVRPMTRGDIAEVVTLQCAFLEGSTITDLGPSFVAAFHRAALSHPQTVAFVASAKGAIAGFVLATTELPGFNAHVRPRVLWPMVRTLASPRGLAVGWRIARGLAAAEPTPAIPAELLLLVVDPQVRRQGIGHGLVARLEDAFAADGIDRYRVAVRPHLKLARAFYEATGFEFEQELAVLGRPMTYLTKRVRR